MGAGEAAGPPLIWAKVVNSSVMAVLELPCLRFRSTRVGKAASRMLADRNLEQAAIGIAVAAHDDQRRAAGATSSASALRCESDPANNSALISAAIKPWVCSINWKTASNPCQCVRPRRHILPERRCRSSTPGCVWPRSARFRSAPSACPQNRAAFAPARHPPRQWWCGPASAGFGRILQQFVHRAQLLHHLLDRLRCGDDRAKAALAAD